MLFFLRILPYLSGAWLAAGDLLAIHQPEHFWYACGLAVLGPILAMWLLARNTKMPESFRGVFFFLVFTLFASVGALLFSEHRDIQIVFVLGIAGIIGMLLEQTFRFRYQPARYQPNALVNISFILALAGMFFFVLTLLDLQIFANAKLWLVVSIFFIVTVPWCVALQSLATAPRAMRLRWGVVILFILVELFALFAWLPAIPIAKAGILTVFMTFILQWYRNDVSEEVEHSSWPFLLLVVMLLLLVGFTHWFA